jgi:hypothetical protein
MQAMRLTKLFISIIPLPELVLLSLVHDLEGCYCLIAPADDTLQQPAISLGQTLHLLGLMPLGVEAELQVDRVAAL